MGETHPPLLVPVVGEDEPTVARALWVFEDARRRTLRALAGLSEAALDWDCKGTGHSIGTLLYHIAATETEWVTLDLMGMRDFPPAVASLLAPGVRSAEGALVQVRGESVSNHLHRLEATRTYSLALLRDMTLNEFRRPRPMALEPRSATPEWVVHHLAQHEAEHRGQVVHIRRSIERRDLPREAAG